MNTKSILLAYTTHLGSTQEAAVIIAYLLRQAGIRVDLQPMLEGKSLERAGTLQLV